MQFDSLGAASVAPGFFAKGEKMVRRLRLYREQESYNKSETVDTSFIAYELGKDFWKDDISDAENWPPGQHVSKELVSRLDIDIESVIVESWADDDNAVVLRLKIHGDEADIEEVNEVLRARYEDSE